MSIKSKILAVGATLALAGAVSATGAIAASAATPPCGPTCINLFSREFGTHAHPNFVMDVFRQTQRVGTPIILFRTSNTDPAEDFTVSAQGTVHSFFVAGLVSAAFDLHFHGLEAFEFEYAPFGADSGLCVGVPSTAQNGTPVSLQPCGTSARTLWVADFFASIKGFYAPLINGSDTNFSHPFVLRYPGNAFPTDVPRPQLQTMTLQGFSNGSTPDNELFGAKFGVLP